MTVQARVRKELSAVGLVATPGHPPLRHLDYAGLLLIGFASDTHTSQCQTLSMPSTRAD